MTSVDCIYLLEQLVNTKFTVEEKNRIRRNLEGYHPLTVSKGRPESGNFFRLIMSFSAPKPRNIEKDVKVFPWKTLGQALKKIISKYSADYGHGGGAAAASAPPPPAPQGAPGPYMAMGAGQPRSSTGGQLPPPLGVQTTLPPPQGHHPSSPIVQGSVPAQTSPGGPGQGGQYRSVQ